MSGAHSSTELRESEWVGVDTGCDYESVEDSQASESVVEDDVNSACVAETDVLLGDFYAEEVMSEDESRLGDNLDEDSISDLSHGESGTPVSNQLMVFQSCPLTVMGSTLLIKKF